MGEVNGERQSESIGTILPNTIGEGTHSLKKGVGKPQVVTTATKDEPTWTCRVLGATDRVSRS